jgi:nucleotide-binding universal stress UspA family protein
MDGSKTAENVLPYARAFAGGFKVPVELLAVVDIGELATRIAPEKGRYIDTLIEDSLRHGENYLRQTARTFSGVNVNCSVKRGRAEEVIIETAASDKGTFIAMATHGRSGLDRWLLGSVAEKVLRGTSNPLVLIRASGEAKTEGEATLKTVIVPLDGSEMAESVLPAVVEMSKKINLEVILFRAYSIPYSAYAGGDGYYAVNFDELISGVKEDARDYLQKKTEELKKRGVEKVSYELKEGLSADQIMSFAKKTPNSLIAMCTHGRSGIERWVLGSVTETVVRHSGNPVLIVRGSRAAA